MTRTYHHKKGDRSAIKKNKSGCKRMPRKEWREGKLNNKYFRRHELMEQLKTSI